MFKLIRSLLFLLPAEKAHHFTTSVLKFLFLIPGFKQIMRSTFVINDPRLNQNVFGIQFPNPVGLAAGFDKNADFLHEFSCLGFGFLEVGTITPKGQPGNPQPRLFRLKKDQALINRMGFNNEGLAHAIHQLKHRPQLLPVGGNIGKNKVTPNENAQDDYLACFHALHELVDYFVVNVSSPNTPNLRDLQEKEPLKALLETLIESNAEKKLTKPILLKIAPDLSESQLNDILEILHEVPIDGVIATNTTIDRSGLNTPDSTIEDIGAGGLSGKPLRTRSTEVIRYIRKHDPEIPIIAVGGIYDVESALEKWDAGANLLQLYTGFVYGGPGLIKRINKAILRRIEEA
ncbi:MAG: quinone-dependent dihydroorotate dehydrogenase [Cytophagales bacterium]|nr:quinone-dependent dihydroorotate dehydrogenase [Cytophagales bacterium]